MHCVQVVFFFSPQDFKKNLYLFIFILECSLQHRLFSSGRKEGLLSSCGAQALIAVASLVAEQGVWASVVVAPGL